MATKHDWTYGFSLEDIAHHARFRGCGDAEAARELHEEYLQDLADEEEDNALADDETHAEEM